MKTKQKIALDQFIGVFVAYPLNFLVRGLGKITRFDHSLNSAPKKIVVCKFKGMGSIVQATPLLATLRKNFPEAEIVFVSTIENGAILSKINVIDRVMLINDQKIGKMLVQTIRLIYQLIRFRADLYIDLEIYSNFSSVITTLSMARDRFGYYLRSNRYRLGMYTHMMYFNTKAPISEAYLQFARLLGVSEIESNLVPVSMRELIPQSLKQIVINVNASDLRFERRWPAKSFVELIRELLVLYPENEIVLIGGKNEKEYVYGISGQFENEPRVLDLSGKTTFDELTETLAQAELLITNDTGPLHLASSLGTRVVALFGPCSPMQYGLGPNVQAIYKNVYCSPCVHEFVNPPCKGDNQCMKLIELQEVLDAVSRSKQNTVWNTIQYESMENHALGKVNR